MPEDEQIGAVAEAEAPTADVIETSPVSTEAVEAETETPAEPKTYTRWQDALADADPEELLKDDRIAGRIGQVADKRAREIAADNQKREAANRQAESDRQEELRLRSLRSENPIAYANEMERKDATTEAIREETRRQASLSADVTGKLQDYVSRTFPREVIESLAGKSYEGSYAEGVTAYIADITKASRAHDRAQWEKEERPALRKQILTELNGSEPSIDSSAGGARAGKNFNSNMEASVALMENRITIQEYTRQALKNGWR